MNNNSLPRPENIAHEAIQILKTVMSLDRNYSVSYLIRILHADERYKLRKEAHKDLETYGILEDTSFSRIEDIVHYLTERDYLRVINRIYGTLEITDQGRSFLSDPRDLEVSRQELSRGWAGIQASIGLRNLRRELAAQTNQAPYEIFTNFVMDVIARRLPTTRAELDQIDGVRNLSDALKERVIEETTRLKELFERNEQMEGALSKAYSPNHRKVKELFEAKFTVEEIARRRGVKPGTVRRILAELHEAEQIDLAPWIEKEVDSLTLHKGAEYFRSTRSPRIDEARQVLGFDYDVLHLCRAYSHRQSHGQVQEPQAAYAA